MSILSTIGQAVRAYHGVANMGRLLQGDPVYQTNVFQEDNLIDHRDRLRPGFIDAGRNVKMNARGYPVGDLPREIVVYKSPKNDPMLMDSIERFRRIDDPRQSIETRAVTLTTFVARAFPKNKGTADPRAGAITADGFMKGEEVSLGDLIAKGTGAARHNALLMKAIADNVGIDMGLVRGYKTASGGLRPHEWNHFVGSDGLPVIADAASLEVLRTTDPEFMNYLSFDRKPYYLVEPDREPRHAANNVESLLPTLSYVRIAKGNQEGVEINVQGLDRGSIASVQDHLARNGMTGSLTTSSAQGGDQVLRFFDPQAMRRVEATFFERQEQPGLRA